MLRLTAYPVATESDLHLLKENDFNAARSTLTKPSERKWLRDASFLS
jgi:hypothetical protein